MNFHAIVQFHTKAHHKHNTISMDHNQASFKITQSAWDPIGIPQNQDARKHFQLFGQFAPECTQTWSGPGPGPEAPLHPGGSAELKEAGPPRATEATPPSQGIVPEVQGQVAELRRLAQLRQHAGPADPDADAADGEALHGGGPPPALGGGGRGGRPSASPPS